MVISDTSIKRPVFATVISLLLLVLGLAASSKLPVREYPAIDPPIVQVTTIYRGASNEVVMSAVTEVIEASIAGIEGIKTMTSISREERSQINIEFVLSRNIDVASSDVRDRIGRIMNQLPPGIDSPRIAKLDADASPILWFTLTSDRRSPLDLTDYATRFLVDRLSVVPGVASVDIGGERRYAMRVWLDRRAMAARNLTVEDIDTAIRRSNVDLPSGRIESTQREFTVKTDSTLRAPEQFSRITVSTRDGYQVRLGEVAKVEIGPEDDRSDMRVNGQPAIGISVMRQSTANTLQVADGAKAEMKRLQENMPADIVVKIPYDESLFIDRSIGEVLHALGIALLLVIGVIFVFLRSVRATLIPTLAIPVSLIATLPILAALGFSINVLTLLALVLAIGIVVDDAIVVLENIHRRIEEGEAPLLASVRGARQIAFAVIATTLVLASVFVPLSFMEGFTGRLFTEFGIALAAAVLFSGLVALSLSPMLCSKLLKPMSGETWLYRTTEPGFRALIDGYRWSLRHALNAPLIVILIWALVAGSAVFLFLGLPSEFAPIEDRGVVMVDVQGPFGSSIDYTRDQVSRIEKMLMPLVASGEATMLMANVSQPWFKPAPVNQANVSVRLAPWEQRSRTQQNISEQVGPSIRTLPGVRADITPPGSLGQRGFLPPVRLVLQGDDFETLKTWRDIMLERMNANGGFRNVRSNYDETKPEMRISVDRLKAADIGVSLDQIGTTLQTMFGSRESGTFRVLGQEYKVIAQALSDDRRTSHDLDNVFVRSRTTNQLIPLSQLVTVIEAAGPQDLVRTDRLRSITLLAALEPNYPIGKAVKDLRQMVAQELPPEARIAWQGDARNYLESQSGIYVTFGLALLIVFLVLAAQFESWIHPFIIMLTVPVAVTGGLLGLALTGTSLNVYSQIGMVLLIGLMAKNGILIVEFANQLRDAGQSVRNAVFEAASIRLRPILMTSIATACGAVPLAMATGAGAESRTAIGVVVIGGTLVSTLITLFVTPAFYLLLARFTTPIHEVARRLSSLEDAHPLHDHAAEAAE